MLMTHLPTNIGTSSGNEEADLIFLDAIGISRVDAQLCPSVRLTTVDCDQHDAELSVTQPAHTPPT